MKRLSFQNELALRNDRHGRNELLIEYIQYQAHLPHPDLRQEAAASTAKNFKQGSTVDDEVGNIMRNGPGGSNAGQGEGKCIEIKPIKNLVWTSTYLQSVSQESDISTYVQVPTSKAYVLQLCLLIRSTRKLSFDSLPMKFNFYSLFAHNRNNRS